MLKLLINFTLIICTVTSLQAQQLGELFELDVYPYHSGIDSIVSIKYLVNEYADDEPNMKFTYDEKEFALHSYETKVLKYLDSYTSISESIQKQTEAKEVQNLKFNEQGKPLYMKLEKSSSEMFNEEKTYSYDTEGRLNMVIRTGYDVMEYESGNTELKTDTTMHMKYGDNNLIESAEFSLDMGMDMKIETEKIGDTIRYIGEMKMSGFAADMADAMEKGAPKSMKKEMMDIVFNKETGHYEATQKSRGGMSEKQIIDKSGNTIESISMAGDKIMKHEKFTYVNREISSKEMLTGEDSGITYNANGQKESEETRLGLFKYEYDNKGNLTKEIQLNPYSLEFQELTVHKIYYSK